MDISTAMSERALAQKRLSENAFDLEAMSMLNRAQERVCSSFFFLIIMYLQPTHTNVPVLMSK